MTNETHETTTLTTTGIERRAMLVQLRMSFWDARKFDRKVTEEVNRLHGASATAGRYNKYLLGEANDAHKDAHKAYRAVRAIHRRLTLDWDDGVGLLPQTKFMAFADEIGEAIREFDEAVARFEAEYPEILERAPDLLNGMFRAEDYPAPDEIRDKFGVQLKYLPVPTSGDFRVELPESVAAEIRQSTEDYVDIKVREAMRDAWNRLFKMVGDIRDRFAKSLEERGDDQRAYHVRQGLLDQARDLVDLLESLNVTDDPDLEAMRREVERDLLAVEDADALKDDDATRRATVDRADEIMDRMRDLYGGPGQGAA